MKIYKSIFLLLLAMFVVSACEELLEPNNDNHSTIDRVYREPSFAEGLLIRAYTYIPTNDYRWDEVATDDAVTNDKLNTFRRMATGEWSASYNPQNLWDNCYRAIIYINQFLDVVEEIPWKPSIPEQHNLFIRRLKGESYALRGMFKYYLLRNHGGFGTNGQLLGTPLIEKFPETQQDFSTPRAQFNDCVNSAYADFDQAINLLPMDYGNVPNLASVPAGFPEVTDVNNYNAVMGDFSRQRISGRVARALRARLALLAASPAFNPSNDLSLWENAANYAAELINNIGGISGLDPNGHKFYLAAQVNDANLSSGDYKDLKENIWRRPIYSDAAREQANFPPSLYGNGRINPSQNLVDAFPMANGYPIDHPSSGFNPASPYSGRDPRLSLYIITSGSTYKGQIINTGVGGGDNAVDAIPTSTRTGYYLKKLLREEVNANPASISNQQHYITHVRYTEIFLIFAEAANEAWGPDGTGPVATYSSRQVIRAIRNRAGIPMPDDYLASITTKEDMRKLIRNERRLELCFESFRFWDLRRWKEDLTVPVRGVRIDGTNFNYFTVEERAYDNSYMHYGPVPYSEVIKYNLIQNNGWK
ncbi:MAG TPA: RagB/SusD family nutrient uptake outer membrane protein [Bacteroidales bacterium]|nr:RagB/SusD family nutrient uptake outer membrane protein [Bacteroidales bacterium]HRR17033.1 RagB/SusD family nutrient uptake outer membrane protein [Bacteroidales bacterium]HRT48473.1 RagB/SusD family nutrient uptake outer membrane protein [Bacteroidales bacterium]HRU57004.1 RagB/SusD family nutrient uptake outer membrane protein [Bacteroidales bacterium]